MIRAGLLSLLLLLTAAPAAFGHARITGSQPERGQTAAKEPKQVLLRFNEPVEGAFGAIRVYDAGARRVDEGKAVHPGGRSRELAVGLKPGLPDGSYTATYRIISADGHPVSGGLVFSIGSAGAGPAKSVDELLGSSEAGPVTEVAFGAMRALQYFATALLLGGLAFLLLCSRSLTTTPDASAAFAARARRLLLAAAVTGLVSGALMIVLQGATADGSSVLDVLDATILGDVLGTRVGTVWAIREGAWLVVLALLLAVRGPGSIFASRLPTAAILPAAGFLLVAPSLSGHAFTQSPRGLLTAADILHVGAMSLWLGGLAFLLLAAPAATRTLEPEARSGALAGALIRFSPLALAAVLTLAVTGTIQAIVHLTAFHQLTGTAFGRAALIKIVLLALLVVLGAINRQRVLPALRRAAAGAAPPGAAGRLLKRTLRAEVALLAVVLGVTGALVGYPPPVALAGGPYSSTSRLGTLLLETRIDPATTGPNEMHLYLLRARDGAPTDAAKEVRATFALPSKGIGAIEATLRKAGPGHYVADTLQIAPAGRWKLEIVARVSAFDELRKTLDVEIR